MGRDWIPLSTVMGVDKEKQNRVREIARKALGNKEEKGLETLYIALGKATWPAETAAVGTPKRLFFFSIELKTKIQAFSDVDVRVRGEIEVNPVLLHVLRKAV